MSLMNAKRFEWKWLCFMEKLPAAFGVEMQVAGSAPKRFYGPLEIKYPAERASLEAALVGGEGSPRVQGNRAQSRTKSKCRY
jgi:hypothetical protein